MDSNDKYIGQMLDNRYEILEKIGTGGMAVVYKARCHRLNRLVAVKILKEEFSDDADFKRRFRSESQAVAMLSHPNIVSVYDVSRSGNIEYIVMELIEGITLKQYINRKGLLNWKESLHFATQIAKALGHAHSRGIIHRDIKPHNIMILKDGSVKVADFGIARLLSTQNTLTQEALGSVHYISPEQAKGAQVDARSDIYSLGVVMYEMLTSRLPFVGDSAVSVAIQHISAIPLMPRDINPEIPVGLEDITMHAMDPDLNMRYSSADEMLRDLEDFRKDPSITFQYVVGSTSSASVMDGGTMPLPSSDMLVNLNGVSPQVRKPVQQRNRPLQPRPKASMTSDEYRSSRKRANRTSLMIGIVGILVFVIVVFVFMWNAFLKEMLGGTSDDAKLTIPKFVGQQYDTVVANSEYTKYYNFLTPEYKESDTYAKGEIMEQSPQADRQMTVANENEKIDVALTVSLGKEEEKSMPNLINVDYRVAESMLKGMGIKTSNIRMESRADDNITAGYIIQQYPEKDEIIDDNTVIYITYSTGPEVEKTKVPGVVGLTESAAKMRLQSYDLSWEIEYVYSSDYNEGLVVFQSIEEGEEVEKHYAIWLQVSLGPEEEPSPSPSPSPSEEPSPSPSEEPSPLPPPSEEPSPEPSVDQDPVASDNPE